MDISEHLSMEENEVVPKHALWNVGIQRTDIFDYNSTSRWFLRLRPYHSKCPSVLLNATHILDSNNWRWKNNTRYLFVCLFVCLFIISISFFLSLSVILIDLFITSGKDVIFCLGPSVNRIIEKKNYKLNYICTSL